MFTMVVVLLNRLMSSLGSRKTISPSHLAVLVMQMRPRGPAFGSTRIVQHVHIFLMEQEIKVLDPQVRWVKEEVLLFDIMEESVKVHAACALVDTRC